ncbi:hypothetical protein FHG87_008726 [Trinorchestia longiramus]|nr:hypothetical protein FHG87_008726 [Trinorchestia longiramus]
MTPHNSSLAYESLPTEEGGAPRSSSHRDPDFSPTISHHPIRSPGSSYAKGKLITGVLVTLLLLASVILGLIIAISARKDAYHKVFGPDVNGDFTSSKDSLFSNFNQNSANSGDYYQPTSGDDRDRGEGGDDGSETTFPPLITAPKSTKPPPPPSTTTTSTTTTTTTTTTPRPTTTTTTTTTPTTTTTTTTTSTTTTPSTTTPEPTLPPTTIAAQPALHYTNDTNDSYDSDLRAVDYMVILQKKVSPAVALAVLVVLVLATVVAVMALVWLVRRRSAAQRRRAHVRRAINELRDQGKAGLLQSDDDV